MIQLIFHRGAKVKDDNGFKMEVESPLLQWISGDRAMVQLKDMQDVEANFSELAHLVNSWIEKST